MLRVVLLACYFQILMKTVNGLCSLQIMANTLYTIKSALFTVSWLCQHNLITICNSSSVNLKFTIRKDMFYSLVWWSKACAIFPVTEAAQIKDVGSMNFVLPIALTGTLNGPGTSQEHAVMGNLQSPGLMWKDNSPVMTSRMARNTTCMKFYTLWRTASNF